MLRSSVDTWVIVASGVHERGGTDRANAALADYLLDCGAQLHLVAHDVDARFADHRSVTVHRVALPLGVSALTDLALGRAGRQVAARLVRERPGTRVVVNGGNCLWPDVNWVHYLHHGWTPPPGAGPLVTRVKDRVVGHFGRARERKALAAARWIVTNSESTSQLVRQHVPGTADRVRCVYLGAEDGWTPPTADERRDARRWLGLAAEAPVVAFVGGLGFDHRKGFDTLWASWQALEGQGHWTPTLVVAGDGAALDYWRAIVGASPSGRRVCFLGFTTKVRELLAAADLLVSPTRYEPFGLNVQEALCRGVPAIVSNTAGVAERYPPHLAGWLLTDPDSSDELSATLARWAGSRDQWRREALDFGERLRAYGWHDMARRLVETVSPSAHAPISALTLP